MGGEPPPGLVVLNLELTARMHVRLQPFIVTYALPDEDPAVIARLADKLALAAEKVAARIKRLHRVAIWFGEPPIYSRHVGTGYEIYQADMSQDPIATAGAFEIHAHASRIANQPDSPIDWGQLFLIEELVHCWMNIQDEEIAKMATAQIYGDGIFVYRGTYYPSERRGDIVFGALLDGLGPQY